jgi:hypothetical protein
MIFGNDTVTLAPTLKDHFEHKLFGRCDLFKTINLDYWVEQIPVWMPAKHLEQMTESNETVSLREMNNQKSWDEINIVQKICLFLCEYWGVGEWKALWEVQALNLKITVNTPYICIMHFSSHVHLLFW